MPKHKKQRSGPRMAFFFYAKDYPDMRGLLDELKRLTGAKQAIKIVHTALRHYHRALQQREAAMATALKDVDVKAH